MNQDIKARWLTALRSGKYEQGRTLLRQFDGTKDLFCCLGVLLDQESVGEWKKHDIELFGRSRDSIAYYCETFLDEDNHMLCDLSYKRLTSYGMERQHQHDLIAMNDGGKTFAEISDWIEANL